MKSKTANPKQVQTGDQLLCAKLTVDAWMIAVTSLDKGELSLHDLIVWPLSRKIDPNKPGQDIELLQESLVELVDAHQLQGRDIAFAIPSSIAELKTLTIPFDLTKKADLKELRQSGQDKSFWQEFDPEILDIKNPYFAYQYADESEDEGSSIIYASWLDQKLINIYTDLLLSAQLYPVLLTSETQSIYNLIFKQIDRLEKESFFGILHIAAGRSQLIAIGPNRIAHAKINISDLDEVLLEDLELIDDIEGPFWDEVGLRIGNAIKQASLYLKEAENIPKLRNIYIVSELQKSDNTLQLLKRHFNLSNLRGWLPASILKNHSPNSLIGIENPSVLGSVLGLGLQRINQASDVTDAQSKTEALIKLNLHPHAKNISKNRKLSFITRRVYWATAGISIALVFWTAGFLLPSYLIAQNKLPIYTSLEQEQKNQSNLIKSIDAEIARRNNEQAPLLQARQEAAKTRFMVTLPTIIPSGVELDSFSITSNKPTPDENIIVISGKATSSSQAQTLYHNLINHRLLKNPVIQINRGIKNKTYFEIRGVPDLVDR